LAAEGEEQTGCEVAARGVGLHEKSVARGVGVQGEVPVDKTKCFLKLNIKTAPKKSLVPVNDLASPNVVCDVT